MGQVDLMRCERRACSLTVTSCAASWNAAQRRRPEPWEGLWHCRSCPIGAANAGKPTTINAADDLQAICPRCARHAFRLIKGRLCVSCYNREREARIGRNAKGSKPRLCGQIHSERIAVFAGESLRVSSFHDVVTLSEAMVLAAKQANAPEITFGRARPVFLHTAPQMELGL